MSVSSESEIQVQQALLPVFSAAEQLRLDPEVLRLMAIGGLTQDSPPEWVTPILQPEVIEWFRRQARFADRDWLEAAPRCP
ncbi:hypothetical protein D3C73_1364370 [compost metagenome]|jgi:hypothetical protein